MPVAEELRRRDVDVGVERELVEDEVDERLLLKEQNELGKDKDSAANYLAVAAATIKWTTQALRRRRWRPV